jgi:hypothetical protein
MNNKEKKEILSKLQDSEKWPSIFKPDFMEELNNFADEIYEKDTVEGMMASLIIYQQIVENMIKSLFEISQFYTRCQLIEFDTKEIKIENKMFRQLLQELEKVPSLPKTDLFIKKCSELNNIRIIIVHKVSHKESIDKIKEESKKSKPLFDEIYNMYDKLYDEWRVCLSALKKDYCDFDIDEEI